MITDKKQAIMLFRFLVIGFVILCISLIYYTNSLSEKYISVIRETAFNGQVRLLESFKSSTIIGVNNEEYILYGVYNDSYDPSFLYDFLRNGDTVVKEPGMDTLHVFRGEEKFFFLLKDISPP
jgi:hypothetical protein